MTEQPHHIEDLKLNKPEPKYALSDEDDVSVVQYVGESSSCQKYESELRNSEHDAQDSESEVEEMATDFDITDDKPKGGKHSL
ncbi:hypothetical protein Tco_0753099 [Tanacetum coccineum]